MHRSHHYKTTLILRMNANKHIKHVIHILALIHIIDLSKYIDYDMLLHDGISGSDRSKSAHHSNTKL